MCVVGLICFGKGNLLKKELHIVWLSETYIIIYEIMIRTSDTQR